MRLARHTDGCVHFSSLKHMSRSPAHYLVAVTTPYKPSREMKVGTISHRIVLGAQPGRDFAIFDGTRRGKAWDEFKAAHAAVEIMTMNEAVEAQAIADAALADPTISALLDAPGTRTEVPLRWKDGGFDCATGGVDIITADGTIADLKTTSTTEPNRWQGHARAMSYHAQLAWLDAACRANGIEPKRHLVIGIEASAPWAVTPLEITPALLAEGKKAICLWLEKLRVAEENDFWPAYVQGPIAFDLPPWMAALEEDGDAAHLDGDDAEEGAAA